MDSTRRIISGRKAKIPDAEELRVVALERQIAFLHQQNTQMREALCSMQQSNEEMLARIDQLTTWLEEQLDCRPTDSSTTVTLMGKY